MNNIVIGIALILAELVLGFLLLSYQRKYYKERAERERADLRLVSLFKDNAHAQFKYDELLSDFNELQEQYAELEAARDHYKEHGICANERAMVLSAELEKCKRQNAELQQSLKPASEDKVADVCKEFCEKLDEAVGELELDIDKLVDECIKELMEGVE